MIGQGRAAPLHMAAYTENSVVVIRGISMEQRTIADRKIEQWNLAYGEAIGLLLPNRNVAGALQVLAEMIESAGLASFCHAMRGGDLARVVRFCLAEVAAGNETERNEDLRDNWDVVHRSVEFAATSFGA
jgi:hypothetical protein